MIPKKFLVGGVATAGSVATAVVVAPGIISSSKETPTLTKAVAQEPNNLNTNPVAARRQMSSSYEFLTRELRPEQKKVKEWLENEQKGKAWKIKVKNERYTVASDFDFRDFKDEDLEGIYDHLNSTETESFLDSLYSGKEISFIFEKTNSGWKHIWTKENIDSWVDKNSGNKAVLGNLSSLSTQDLESLYTFLKAQTDLFSNLPADASPDNKKTMLFEKDSGGDWKRTKTEIESWLALDDGGNGKFSIEIKRGDEEKKTLDNTDEANLVGLLDYLKREKNELFRFAGEDPDTPLTFVKGAKWDVVKDNTTIPNWIGSVFSGKALNVWKNDKQERNLPNLEIGELKELFSYLKDNNNKDRLLKSSSETIIFEKYSGKWMPVKEAIEQLLKDMEWDIYKSKIKIKKGASETLIGDSTEDEELTGLTKHLKGKDEDSDYMQCFSKSLVLEKEDGSSWKYSCGS